MESQTLDNQSLDTEHDQDTTPEDDDRDSGFGDEKRNSTFTADSSPSDFLWQDGRRYHAYNSHANYPFPNDKQAQEVEARWYVILLKLFEGKLCLAPCIEPQRVLDIGTGTGRWAIDFADLHPQAIVEGTDLSPIQPGWVPPNCFFTVDDAEDPWFFSDSFDLIRLGNPYGSFNHPERLFEQAYANLNFGGWFEIQDRGLPKIQVPTLGDDAISTPSFDRWITEHQAALCHMKRDPELAQRYEMMMRRAGFNNVQYSVKCLPLNSCCQEPGLGAIGRHAMINFLGGLEAFTLRLFTQTGRWSLDEVQLLLVEVRKEVQDRTFGAYIPIYTVYGQKPRRATTTAEPAQT